jgi:hypothetical protein
LDSSDVAEEQKALIANTVMQQACVELARVLSAHGYLRVLQRTANAVTFYVSALEKHLPQENSGEPESPLRRLQCKHKRDFALRQIFALQVVGWYGSVFDLINSFDLGACHLAFTNGRCVATRKGALSLRLAANFVNINDVSPQ